jgi:light-regulated signal transduction histidine kinase (bacteriophytochrome)
MKLRDIVNREIVSLTNCESEPIHIPGAIQPHGFLLALKGADFIIDFCSANSAGYCDATPEQLLGKRFAQCFGDTEAARLADYLLSKDFSAGNPLALALGPVSYSCTINKVQDGLYTLEAEPFPDGLRNLPDLYQQTRKFTTLLQRTQSLNALCQDIAEETRAITGYDRVMVYRFDAEYNGEVIAEAKDERYEPFLNLHYPHTDIPVQARELYLRNLLRMIADVHYIPVPILTVDDAPDKNLDLSHSVLRSVSPIHIEYLKNMGVGATLTISLIHEKRLWGLITCHHYSPKNIPHYTRLSAQLQGHFLTSQIAVRELNEAFEAGRENALALEALLPLAAHLKDSGLKVFDERHELLDVAGATGVAIKFYDTYYSAGSTPPQDHVAELAAWCARNDSNVFISDAVGKSYSGAAAARQDAAGVLFYSLAAGDAHYIVWFKKEQQEEVIWAGDPAKAIVKDEGGLSPRKSFQQWRQQTRGKSKPWTEGARTAASNFAHSLQRELTLILLGAEEQRYRRQTEQLQEANDELERINWISTHDLQEPLRKIQIFGSRALNSIAAAQTDKEIIHSVERMSAAANRMQNLTADIHEYAKLLHKGVPLEPTQLDTVLAEVLQTLGDELTDIGAMVTVDPLPEVAGAPFLLRQVFTNLLRNAIKFSRHDAPLTIHISARQGLDASGIPGLESQPRGYHCVSVSDNGIGFDNAFADSIFGLFKRLHTQKQYSGTGIGLALCRKVMLRHNGTITARGEQGRGATFELWFPA